MELLKRGTSTGSAAKSTWLGRASTATSYSLIAICLLLIATSLVASSSWRQQNRQLLGVLEDSELLLERPDLASQLQTESTAHHAQLLVARNLVYDSLRRSVEASEEERHELATRLPSARELAQRALARQPNSWQAAMLMGTATYLERSLLRDRRLFTEASLWEAPLRKAVEDASGHPEPRRLLATAYLEVWHALSAEKKIEAQSLLAQVFRDDQRAMEALMPAWLAIRQPRQATYEVIPPDPSAWKILIQGHAERRQWGAFSAAYEKYLEALETHLDAERVEAEQRLALGERYISRSLLLGVVIEAPPSMRFAPLVEASLSAYPPGLHGLKATAKLRSWLDWALELSPLGLRPLSSRAMVRLLDSMGEVAPHLGAHAAQVAGDTYQAERYARLTESLKLKSWAPYLLAKTESLLDEGKSSEAQQVLAQMPLSWHEELTYLVLRLRVARGAGSPGEIRAAEERLRQEQATEWSGYRWRRLDRRQTMMVLPATDAEGLEIRIAGAAQGGTVVEVRWDGESVALKPAYRDDWLRVEQRVTADSLHLLEIHDVASGRDDLVPAEVRLLLDER